MRPVTSKVEPKKVPLETLQDGAKDDEINLDYHDNDNDTSNSNDQEEEEEEEEVVEVEDPPATTTTTTATAAATTTAATTTTTITASTPILINTETIKRIPKRNRLDFFNGAAGREIRLSASGSIDHLQTTHKPRRCLLCRCYTTVQCSKCTVHLCKSPFGSNQYSCYRMFHSDTELIFQDRKGQKARSIISMNTTTTTTLTEAATATVPKARQQTKIQQRQQQHSDSNIGSNNNNNNNRTSKRQGRKEEENYTKYDGRPFKRTSRNKIHTTTNVQDDSDTFGSVDDNDGNAADTYDADASNDNDFGMELIM